jgi:hypothetical protein
VNLPFVVQVRSNQADRNWFFIYTRSHRFLLRLSYVLVPITLIFLMGEEHSWSNALAFCALATCILVAIHLIDYLNFRIRMKKVDKEGDVIFHADSYQLKYPLGEITQKYETIEKILLYKHMLILNLGEVNIFFAWKNVPEENIEELKAFLTSLKRPSRKFTY